MSSDDWWNSTPTAEEEVVGSGPSSVDPSNVNPINVNPSSVDPSNVNPSSVDPSSASPEESEETIPLQPRSGPALSPNNPPKPAPADLSPRSNLLHPSSRSPSSYGRPSPDRHHYGSNGGHDLLLGHTGPGHESGTGYGHGTGGYGSGSGNGGPGYGGGTGYGGPGYGGGTGYGGPGYGGGTDYDGHGPGHGHGYGVSGGKPIDPDTPEWSTYHHEHSHKKVDRNTFKRNMTIAKGFLDISLLSANSNQLRNLLNFGDRNQTRFYVTLTALITSLCLQLVTGVVLIIMERWNINKPHHQQWSLRLNNAVTVLVFLTLIINCLVSSMGVSVMQHDLAYQQDLLTRGARDSGNHSIGGDLLTSG